MIIAWDTETELIARAKMAPRLVCLQWLDEDRQAGLVNHWDAVSVFRSWLEDGHTIVGHNVAYDCGVMAAYEPRLLPPIFRAYEEGRILCTEARMKLLDNAAGCLDGYVRLGKKPEKIAYSLAFTIKRLTGEILDKDTWRLRYGELRDIPVHEWPSGALGYALDDGRVTFEAWERQERKRLEILEKHGIDLLADQANQTRKQWCLHLTAAWGLRTDPRMVDRLEQDTQKHIDATLQRLKDIGFVRANGKRHMAVIKKAVTEAYNGSPPVTEKGAPKTDKETCEEANHPHLDIYSEYAEAINLKSKDIPMLRAGATMPIQPRFNYMLATGRTSSRKHSDESPLVGGNVQNPRRKEGVRECYVPRPGCVYGIADVDGAELHALAQICYEMFGYSRLGDVLNSGRDGHLDLAAHMMGIEYDEIAARHKQGDPDVKHYRQMAKVPNFGFPGGMGPGKLVLFAKQTYGIILTEQQCKDLRAQWLSNFPEMKDYFRHWGDKCAALGYTQVHQLYSGRIRGKARYTQACNSMFQGLTADATAAAYFEQIKACYIGPGPLFGCRVVNFVHDEFITEIPETPRAHDAAMQMSEIIETEFNKWVPRCPTKAEPLLARRWSKGAKPVYDATGRLVPWEWEKA